MYKNAAFAGRGVSVSWERKWLLLGVWWGCALRRHPKLNREFVPHRTHEGHDAMLIESAAIDGVIDDARRMLLHFTTLAGLAGIDDHVSGRCRVVLQFDDEVIEPGFFIVPGDVGEFVKSSARRFRNRNRYSAIGRAFE